MATQTAKTPGTNGKIAADTGPSSTGRQTIAAPAQDAKLVTYVRGNIEPIVAGLIAMSAHAGEERDWQTMNEYQTLAGQLSQLGGLGETLGRRTETARAMAAGAGAR
ncbi:hypothetical protein [Nevskia soli]|uniref:hypothetical protein n=1 Tax=Nevskia soli TaxID=418856 RepID=UPI0015D82DD2|nr:hypothetical protein [Nevskia soli]